MLRSLNNHHHATLLIGKASDAQSYVKELLFSVGMPAVNSPNFIIFRDSTFGIDEARKLTELASRRAFGNKQFFLIIPERLTGEAQNALLKTFEDPSPETFFFLVSKEDALILPTLRSRMNTVRLGESDTTVLTIAERFLQNSIKERILFVKKFVDGEMNLSNFLDELMLVLRCESKKKELEQVYTLKRFADDRSASARLILEHLSLVL